MCVSCSVQRSCLANRMLLKTLDLVKSIVYQRHFRLPLKLYLNEAHQNKRLKRKIMTIAIQF